MCARIAVGEGQAGGGHFFAGGSYGQEEVDVSIGCGRKSRAQLGERLRDDGAASMPTACLIVSVTVIVASQ